MTSEVEQLRRDLQELLASPAIGLPDYGADPKISRRFGAMLAAVRAEPLPDHEPGRPEAAAR